MSSDLNTHLGAFIIVQPVNQTPGGFFQIFDEISWDKWFTQGSGLHVENNLKVLAVRSFRTNADC